MQNLTCYKKWCFRSCRHYSDWNKMRIIFQSFLLIGCSSVEKGKKNIKLNHKNLNILSINYYMILKMFFINDCSIEAVLQEYCTEDFTSQIILFICYPTSVHSTVKNNNKKRSLLTHNKHTWHMHDILYNALRIVNM